MPTLGRLLSGLPSSSSANRCVAWVKTARLRALLQLLLCSCLAGYAQQGAHVSYQLSYCQNQLSAASSIAVDASGNVFFVSGGAVYRTLANSCSPTTLPIPANEGAGSYVAVDGSGNVFFDATNGSQSFLVKATYSSANDSYVSANLVSNVSGLNTPGGVAVDAAGNVFLSATASGPRAVLLKFPANSATGNEVLTNPPYASALAVDANGNVYFLLPNTNNGQVLESVLQNSAYQTPTPVLSGICTFFTSCGLTAMALDSSGSLLLTNTSGSFLLRFPIQPSGGYAANDFAILDPFGSAPNGVAADREGAVYTEASGYLSKLTPPTATNLGTVALGNSATPATLQFRFNVAAQLGSVSILTRGASGLDFYDAGGGTCLAGQSFAQGASCTVNVGFTASNYAGPRYGAISLVDASGTVLSTGYVYGTASGSQFAFSNPFAATLPTTAPLSTPLGIAVDGNRAVFLGDSGNGQILRETPNGNGGYTQAAVVTGVNNLLQLALDGAGDLYFIASNSSNVYVLMKALSNGASYGTPTLIASGFNSPQGLAADAAGNVFVMDGLPSSTLVLKETYLAGSYTQNTVLTVANNGGSLAVDGSGNLYLGAIDGTISMSTLQPNGTYPAPTVIASGLGSPAGLALDGAGDLYVTDASGNRVVRLAAGTWTQTTIPSSFSTPDGIAVDDAGDVYVMDTYRAAMAPAGAPSLSFAATQLGTTSSDSPQTATIENIGNAALTFGSFPFGTMPNPSISTNFSLGSSSTCPQLTAGATSPLAIGATCTYLISFAPTQTVGNLSGTLGVQYEDQNPGYTTKTVNLSGVAIGPAAATPTFSPAGGTYAAAQTVSISDTTPTPFGAIYYTVDGTTPTTNSRQYTGPVNVSTSETLKAIAAASGYSQSAVGTAVYTIESPPVCSVSVRPTSTASQVAAQATCTDPQNSALTYSFNWGDNTSPTVGPVTATHTYAAPGTYTVTLTATDALGLSGTATATVTPNQLPACSVSVRPTSTASAVAAQAACTDPQNSALASYSFNWGDNTSPTVGPATAAHTYAAPGTYTVTLTATDALGLSGTASQAVTPNQPPACTLTLRGTSTASVLAAQATCTDPQGSALPSYTFTWGDGSAPTSGGNSSASHLYAAPGAYTVTLTATDALGLSGTATQSGRPNQVPVCTLGVSPSPTVASATAQASCTDPQNAALTTYSFNWGDNTTPSAGASSTAAHIYHAPGTYTVRLTATDAVGLSGTATQQFTSQQPPVCTFLVAGSAVALGVTAQVSCTDPQNSPLTYLLTWGDNSQTGNVVATNLHTYAAPGTYTVTLTATDALGLQTTLPQTVTPNQLPVCTLSVIEGSSTQLINGLPNTVVSATPTCTSPQGHTLSMTILWGGGATSNVTSGTPVTHAYVTPTSALTETVSLTATDLSTQGTGTATQAVALLPLASPPAGSSATAAGTAVGQPNGVPATQVTFLCTGLQVGSSTATVLPSAYGITCTSPTITASAGANVPVQVSIQTTAGTALAAAHPDRPGAPAVLAACFWFPAISLLSLGLRPPKRRLRNQLHAGGLLLLLCFTICSCGGSFTPPPVVPTPQGLYLLTITEVATSGATPTSFVQTSLIVPLQVK